MGYSTLLYKRQPISEYNTLNDDQLVKSCRATPPVKFPRSGLDQVPSGARRYTVPVAYLLLCRVSWYKYKDVVSSSLMHNSRQLSLTSLLFTSTSK
jgi:hypothetical protein